MALLGTVSAGGLTEASANGAPALAVLVNGRPLSGPHNLPEQRGDRLFLPIVTIARALGDQIQVDPAQLMVTVRRQTGIKASYDGRLGQVQENGVPILVSKGGGPLSMPALVGALMLPSEILAALLEVSVLVDRQGGVVRVDRTTGRVGVIPTGATRGWFDLFDARYIATGAFGSGFGAYTAQLAGTGRLVDGRWGLSTAFYGDNVRTPFDLQQGLLSYQRPGGQLALLGDFVSSTELLFASSLMRGARIQQPLDPLRRVILFAGMTPSAGGDPIGFERFDTFMAGSYFTFNTPNGPTIKPRSPFDGALGMLYFNGPLNHGGLMTGAAGFKSNRLDLRGDLGLGGFKGAQFGGHEVSDAALMSDLRAVYRPMDTLSLQGHVAHIGSSFTMPQMGGLQRPMNYVAAGAAWAARPWLRVSSQGRWFNRLDPTGGHNLQVTNGVGLTPASPLPSASLTHTQGWSTDGGLLTLLLMSVVEEWSRWTFSGNLLVFEAGESDPSVSGTVGAAVKVQDVHRFSYAQTFSGGGATTGIFGWTGAPLLKGHAALGAGFGWQKSGDRVTTFGRLSALFKLPFSQQLQVSYQHYESGYQVFASLSGPLYRAPDKGRSDTAEVEQIQRLGDISGRVFHDRNLDGRFDPKVDEPQPDVEIQVDGCFYAKTDAQGRYRIKSIPAGMKRIGLNLLTVRADLTFVNGPELTAQLLPGGAVDVSFRVVRTGAVTGVVWVDQNNDGKVDKGEEPMAEVRVLTANQRDTVTDEDGEYRIADLPPGEHVLLVDEKTLPEGAVPVKNKRTVQVKPAQTVEGVNFPVRYKAQEVEVKEFPAASQPAADERTSDDRKSRSDGTSPPPKGESKAPPARKQPRPGGKPKPDRPPAPAPDR